MPWWGIVALAVGVPIVGWVVTSIIGLRGKAVKLDTELTGLRITHSEDQVTRDRMCDAHQEQIRIINAKLDDAAKTQQGVAESVAYIRGKIEVAINGN